jgi:hypothetical protein
METAIVDIIALLLFLYLVVDMFSQDDGKIWKNRAAGFR